MDYRYKQLEQDLSALSKVFSDLGVRLSEVAKEVASPGVMPSEKLLEQISLSRTSFENCRAAIHGHAGSMLVSPLPKMGDLVSIAAIESLLKAAAVAEESKLTIEAERGKALEILGRVLNITHRETAEYKPLQECQTRLGELRSAISNVLWPHRHPESEAIVADRHPANSLLNFVENLDALEDDKWMALETTITETYGKPLFVAASRGKLTVGADAKTDVPPASRLQAVPPVPAKAPAAAPPEAPKPVAATEKPVEKKVVEKAAEKPVAVPAVAPAVTVERKVAAPPPVAPPPAAPAVAMERKEPGPERIPQKPVVPQAGTAAVPTVSAIPAAPALTAETKESLEKPAPATPQATPSVIVTPPAVGSVPPVATPPAHSAPVASVPLAAPPRPPAPIPVAATPAPAPSTPPVAIHSPASPSPQSQQVPGSLTALASATETDKRPAPAPPEAIDRQRREPRLATPTPVTVAKTEPNGEEFTAEEAEKAAAGDSSQRPQRWGFWRGNRS